MAQKGIKEFLLRYYRYFIIGGLFVALVIVLIVVWSKNSKKGDIDEENYSTIAELETTVDVPKDKYKLNEYDDINSLVKSYLDAMSIGDIATMSSLSSSMTEEMVGFYEAQAKYVGNYSNYNVYTKVGPRENSFVVLATYDLTINGLNGQLPALLSLYVCRNEAGALYVNSENLPADEEAYILELVSQKDFADLINQVEMDYNNVIEKDENLAAATKALKEEINQDAQAILIAKQQEELENAALAEAQAQQEAKEAAAVQVRCTKDNVNIRATASTDAESLGKTSIGDVYTRYEAMDNGWSKVEYNGSEAFIYSEYLEVVSDGSEGGEKAELMPGSKITVKENVNVRKSPSQTAEKITTVSRGEQFDLIEVVDGWCKVTYKGEVAYIKADYVE